MVTPTLLAGANGVMCALFLLFAAVQYNDPDPLPWIAIYAAAAAVCALWIAGRRRRAGPGAVGLVAAIWAATIIPRVAGQFAWGDVFATVHMQNETVELVREALGLSLVGCWMLVLVLSASHRTIPDNRTLHS